MTQPASGDHALIRVPARTAAEVAVPARLRPAALALLRPDQAPRQFLDELLARELYPDALRFLVHALLRRDGIWWGALCLRLAAGAAPPPRVEAALRLAAAWVVAPTEDHRKQAAQSTGRGDAAAYLLKAIGWTGGSLTPPGLPFVAPGPGMSLGALNAAVKLAATAPPAARFKERQRHFLVLGIRIAQGKYSWAPPHPHA